MRSDHMLVELKRAGLKLTPQRIAIVRELADDLTHPTAQDLFERLRASFPTMSFATVYNTLETLAKCGLSQSLRLHDPRGPHGAVRFDPNTTAHHHAVCDRCGTITDIPSTEAPTTPKDLRDFEIRAEERIFRGLCGRCRDR